MTIAVILLVISVTALVAWLAYELLKLRKIIAAVPEDGGVFESLRRLDEDLAAVERQLQSLGPRVLSLEGKLPDAISHTAVVTYDAYGNITGRLSRSIALLNQRGDGLVLSLLVGRDDTLWFTKEIRHGKGTQELSPEEQEAVRRAIGTLPE